MAFPPQTNNSVTRLLTLIPSFVCLFFCYYSWLQSGISPGKASHPHPLIQYRLRIIDPIYSNNIPALIFEHYINFGPLRICKSMRPYQVDASQCYRSAVPFVHQRLHSRRTFTSPTAFSSCLKDSKFSFKCSIRKMHSSSRSSSLHSP